VGASVQRQVRRLTLAVIVVASACTNDDAAPRPAAEEVTVTTATATSIADDGVLTLGLLVPLDGEAAQLGTAVEVGVTLAVADINRAGGVLGEQVRLAVRDEGRTDSEARTAIGELEAAGVDAIIGPISSLVTLSVLDQIVGNGRVACSPTASALALDEFPDRGQFVRTVASDSLQAVAIAAEVERTGSTSATIVAVDDAFGRPFAAAVASELQRRGVDATNQLLFRSGVESISQAEQAVVESDQGTVVVIGDATDGPAMLRELSSAQADRDLTYVVNGHQQGEALQALAIEGLAARVVGIRNASSGESRDFDRRFALAAPDVPSAFALNAYDCATLLSLAFEAGASRESLVSSMLTLSNGGSQCLDFADCAVSIRNGRNTDYDGPGGRLALNTGAVPSSAVFEVFRFDIEGQLSIERVTVSY
jgi:branched-chain amino acid transport system substrate-binding protein